MMGPCFIREIYTGAKGYLVQFKNSNLYSKVAPDQVRRHIKKRDRVKVLFKGKWRMALVVRNDSQCYQKLTDKMIEGLYQNAKEDDGEHVRGSSEEDLDGTPPDRQYIASLMQIANPEGVRNLFTPTQFFPSEHAFFDPDPQMTDEAKFQERKNA
jgi:hypothetical protein